MVILDIVQALNALPAVHSVATKTNWQIKETLWGMQLVSIPFLKAYPNGVLSPDSVEVAVSDMDLATEAAYWWKAVPALLREETTTPEIRQPFFTNATYKTGIEAEFVGWEILKMDISVEGTFDRAQLTAINPETDMIVYVQLMIWMEDGTPRWKMIENK